MNRDLTSVDRPSPARGLHSKGCAGGEHGGHDDGSADDPDPGGRAWRSRPGPAAQDHAVPARRRWRRRLGGGGGATPPGVHSSGGGSSSGGGYSPAARAPAPGSTYAPSTAERRHPRAGTGRGGRRRLLPGLSRLPGGRRLLPGLGAAPAGTTPATGAATGGPTARTAGTAATGATPGAGAAAAATPSTTPRSNAPGSVRVLVDPAEARVYVDGYYAGTVDDFDGLFQRLNVSPGRHEITLKLEGYKTHRMKVYVPPETHDQAALRPREGHGRDVRGPGRRTCPRAEMPRDRERGGPRSRSATIAPRDEDDGRPSAGRLRSSVRPADASVYVDGAFRGTAREAVRAPAPAGPPPRRDRPARLPDGRARGRGRPGETTELEVDLEPERARSSPPGASSPAPPSRQDGGAATRPLACARARRGRPSSSGQGAPASTPVGSRRAAANSSRKMRPATAEAPWPLPCLRKTTTTSSGCSAGA